MAEKEGIGKAVGKSLVVKNAATLQGTLAVSGAATLASTLAVTGNTTVGGTAAITGNTTVGGTLAVTGAVTGPNLQRTVTVPVTGGTDTGGGLFAWTNPEAGSIIILRATLDVTTIATGACTASIGTTSTNATTLSNNLITGLDVHAGTGTFDNIGSPGGSGKATQKLASGKWVTGSTASGASAGLVGNAYITYVLA